MLHLILQPSWPEAAICWPSGVSSLSATEIMELVSGVLSPLHLLPKRCQPVFFLAGETLADIICAAVSDTGQL